jgi:hypothetical protein
VERGTIEPLPAPAVVVERSGVRARRHVTAPPVNLGALAERGLAPAVFAMVERGAQRRPALARSLRCEVELNFDEDYPPVRVAFAGSRILVEDGNAVAPDLRVFGAMGDLVHITTAPLIAGLPSPIARRGRAVLADVAGGRVRIEGRIGLLRRLAKLIRIA